MIEGKKKSLIKLHRISVVIMILSAWLGLPKDHVTFISPIRTLVFLWTAHLGRVGQACWGKHMADCLPAYNLVLGRVSAFWLLSLVRRPPFGRVGNMIPSALQKSTKALPRGVCVCVLACWRAGAVHVCLITALKTNGRCSR